MGNHDEQMSTASFGYWVKRRRLALDLTQAALAQRVSCATVTIKKIEQDLRRPSRQMARRLAESLSVEVDRQELFVECARGERPVDHLRLTQAPVEDALLLPPMAEVSTADTPPRLFVGREQELAQLDAALQAALDGAGQVAFVAGEAGRGKTALLEAFARRALDNYPQLAAAAGSGNAFIGAGDPYLPFREILATLAGARPSNTLSGLVAMQAERLRATAVLTAQAVRIAGPHLVDVFVPQHVLSGAGAPQSPPAGAMRPEAGQRQLFQEAAEVLALIARKRPLLLLLDDMQWIDAASVNLLFHLARRLAQSPLLVVGAYRPSEVGETGKEAPQQQGLALLLQELQRQFGQVVIDLEPFVPRTDRAFVDALLDAEPNALDEAFRLKLFWRTRGHALFTVELLQEMRTRGDLVQNEAGVWVQEQEMDWESLPARTEAVIARRLARLDGRMREALAVASVEGEQFTAQLVAKVLNMDERWLLGELARDLQQQHQLVLEQGERAVAGRRLSRFQFSHVLFRDYLYAQLGEGQRRLLHGEAARALEALYGDAESSVVQLGHHYAEAGEAHKAANYLLQAGDVARSLYAHEEASDHYHRALQLLKELGDRERAARTLMKLGLTYHTAFDFDNAHRSYEEGFALWQQLAQAPGAQSGGIGHTLRVNWLSPMTLDPTRGAFHYWSTGVVSQLFSGLVELSADLNVMPNVAESWKVENEGRRYIFSLRDDVRWSDGVPVTAHDVAYAWKRALDPAEEAPLKTILLHVVRGAQQFNQGQCGEDGLGIEVRDERTLVVDLLEPTAYFPHLVAFPALCPLPRHRFEPDDGYWEDGSEYVSNGPLILAERGEDRLLLKRNPLWHGRTDGNVDRVHLITTGDPDELLRMYEEDALDVLNLWPFPAHFVDRARHRHAGDYLSGPQLLTYFLKLNLNCSPVDDVRVRRALVLAADRRQLADVALNGVPAPATGGLVPPGMPGHAPGITPAPDFDEARALLAQAGYPGGAGFPPLQCAVRSAQAYVVEPLLQAWERALGIEWQIRDYALAQNPFQEADVHVALGMWSPTYPDPDSQLRVLMRQTAAEIGWEHAVYEDLVQRARQAADQEVRLALYRQAEQILVKEVPILPLAYGRIHLLLKPWVKRFHSSTVRLDIWHETVIDDACR